VATGISEVSLRPAPASSVRLSGTELSPTWRGRLHLGALLVSVPAAGALIWRDRTAPIIVYACCLVGLFAVSSGYHLLPLSVGRRGAMRRADHAMIYVFTAASYTPFCILAVPGALGRVVLVLVWAGAAVGVAIKVFGFQKTQLAGSVLYVLLGWLAIITLPGAARNLGITQWCLLVAMGVLYSAGAVVLFTRRPDPVPHVFGYHEVWHASVVLASACYFAMIWGLPGLQAR
jgi:hemolysin III